MDPRQRYVELCARVDAFFARVRERHGQHMQCGAGCADCCHDRLSVTLVEAAHIAEGLAGLPAKVRALLRRGGAETVAGARGAACAALGADGRCQIYPWRPLICRSHGVPVAVADEAGPGARVRLPVIEVCPRNFTGVALDRLDAGAVLDQTTLSTVLGAIDAAFADACGAPRGARIDLAELVADPDSFFAVE